MALTASAVATPISKRLYFQGSPDLDEDLLDRVLRLGGVGTGPACERPDEAAESSHHVVDGARLLPSDSLKNRSVAIGGDSSIHGGTVVGHVSIHSIRVCGGSMRPRTMRKCIGTIRNVGR